MLEHDLLELVGARAAVSNFLVAEDCGRAWSVEFGDELSSLIHWQSVSLAFRIDGATLRVGRPKDAFHAEAALRLVWFLATRELGGVLIHASAVELDGKAALVTGVSTTGKTTIARHCQALGARLLSDEIIQVLPGRRVHGTPFRSDPRCIGTPGGADLKLWLTIDKGPDEALLPWPGRDVMRTSLAQVFSLPELAPPDEAGRLASLLDGVPTRRLRCRNHPDAGAYLLAALKDAP